MKAPKWVLLTRLPESGFLRLLQNLNHVYVEDRDNPFRNVEVAFRINDGLFDVNVLSKDWDRLRTRLVEEQMIQRYRTEDVL